MRKAAGLVYLLKQAGIFDPQTKLENPYGLSMYKWEYLCKNHGLSI